MTFPRYLPWLAIGLLLQPSIALASSEPAPSPPSLPIAAPLSLCPAKQSPDRPTATPPTPQTNQPTSQPSERQQLLITADRLYCQEQFAAAEQLYRKAKGSFTGLEYSDRPVAIGDVAALPPAGQVYWREAAAGQAQNLDTRVTVPLQLLTEQYPEFIPGVIRYAEVLLERDRAEDALALLERATALYPDQPELVQARIAALAQQERWMEASIAARQFALLYPDQPAAAAMQALAVEHLDQFKRQTRRRLTSNTIANVFTGAIGFALTGGLLGPISAIQSTVLLLRGESAVGEGAANQIKRELTLVDDPAVQSYVNQLGQQLARVAGRDEFEYEFYVVLDEEINAFALPGGKVFINAGAIVHTNSEAELAGLIAHELAHAVLSHGFQLATSSNTIASLFQLIPYAGGLATELTVTSYSRDMENQADRLGTRMLASAGYAADGMYNLMVTLKQQDDQPVVFDWLSTHPDTDDRIQQLERLIEENGYNRYTYEGVEPHREAQERVRQILAEQIREDGEGGENGEGKKSHSALSILKIH